MGIASKTGDDGYTDLPGGERLRKDHPVAECLGTLDELNAFLGDAKAATGDCAPGTDIRGIITGIQDDLFTIMGALAGTAGVSVPATARLDSLIAGLEASLPPLTSFVVPGANPASAKLHVARTVCRRAERRLIALDRPVIKDVLPYLNRLSGLLFLLAQKAALE